MWRFLFVKELKNENEQEEEKDEAEEDEAKKCSDDSFIVVLKSGHPLTSNVTVSSLLSATLYSLVLYL